MTAGFNTAYMKNKLYTSFFATLGRTHREKIGGQPTDQKMVATSRKGCARRSDKFSIARVGGLSSARTVRGRGGIRASGGQVKEKKKLRLRLRRRKIDFSIFILGRTHVEIHELKVKVRHFILFHSSRLVCRKKVFRKKKGKIAANNKK